MAESEEPQAVEHHAEDLFEHEQNPGDTFFALFFVVISVFLLSQIGEQTKWVNGVETMMQPRIWPLMSLIGMVIFGLGYLFYSFKALRKQTNSKLFETQELINWAKPVEYACYFLVYVYLVPIIGYLLASILLFIFLCLRTGYWQPRMLLIGVVIALLIVLLFKTFLQVKIPGGQIYEWFPDNIRNFLITYF